MTYTNQCNIKYYIISPLIFCFVCMIFCLHVLCLPWMSEESIRSLGLELQLSRHGSGGNQAGVSGWAASVLAYRAISPLLLSQLTENFTAFLKIIYHQSLLFIICILFITDTPHHRDNCERINRRVKTHSQDSQMHQDASYPSSSRQCEDLLNVHKYQKENENWYF